MAEIGIIRMPMGNLQSVVNAVYENGFDPVMLEPDADLDMLSHLIVPGVGHFRGVITELEALGWPERIKAFAASGRPTLGICVGMQLLATTGTEGGETPGLGLIPARVERLVEPGSRLRLPHVGWNTVRQLRRHPVLEGVKPDRDFYFVHSYAMVTEDPTDTIGAAEYGRQFAAVVGRANVIGFQFHPEKSQVNGLKLLENFCDWDGRC